MKCFSCNELLPNSVSEDRPTGRYYCGDCFSWTLDEQLRLAGLEEFTDPYRDLDVLDVFEVEGTSISHGEGPVTLKELNEVNE